MTGGVAAAFKAEEEGELVEFALFVGHSWRSAVIADPGLETNGINLKLVGGNEHDFTVVPLDQREVEADVKLDCIFCCFAHGYLNARNICEKIARAGVFDFLRHRLRVGFGEDVLPHVGIEFGSV